LRDIGQSREPVPPQRITGIRGAATAAQFLYRKRLLSSIHMRVLVTGAGGFIGRHLCAALPAAGHRVVGAMRDADAVVHLANIAHARAAEAELQRVNVAGTLERAREAAACGARRFVYLSSALAVDATDRYGRSKLAAERGLAQLQGIEVVILRPPVVYGPRVKANFLALLRAVAHGVPLPLASIRNRRSLVYIGNLNDAIARCLVAPQAAGGNFGVTDGAPIAMPDLCRRLGEALGRPARLFAFPPALLARLPVLRKLAQSLEVDDAPLRARLGWQPPFSLEEGLRRTAEWHRTSGG
jgi:nucleoside-diphosphate-sugar epimerase